MSIQIMVEMGYDDYDSFDQQTPSRLESIVVATESDADRAEELLRQEIAKLPEDVQPKFNFWRNVEDSPSDPEAVIAIIADMAAHYIGDDKS